MKSLDAVDLPDEEIEKITWRNACDFYRFDPFQHVPHEQATVGALRALASGVDTTPRPLGAEETHVNILDQMQAMARHRIAK